MKAAFKWRLQNGIYGYLIDEDNQNGPFAYDISDHSRIYPDGTIETGATVNEGKISTTVSKFSRDEYINAFSSFKSFINASYPQVSLLDVMYYYNIENDECTASASSLKCSATDIIFDATAVEGSEFSVVVTNEQTDPNTGEALRYKLDFTFPNTTSSGVEYTAGNNIDITTGNTISALGYRYDQNKNSIAVGSGTQAKGINSYAEGEGCIAFEADSHAEGKNTQATNHFSHAEGNQTFATGQSSHAEGYETIASGLASHAEGAKYNNNRKTESAGQASHAEGASTYAKADGTHAEGILNIAGRFLNEISAAAQELGISGTPQELVVKLLGYGAHVEGMNNKALGSCSHSEGNATEALANSTHAEGDTTIAFGEASHAEGYNTQAKGNQSHAEGSSTIAIGNSAHAEGVSTDASGSFSHAEGSHTKSTGRDSHAEGAYNKAIGIASHAEGENTEANGNASHAEGVGTTTNNEGEHAEGLYNKSNTSTDTSGRTIHSIGIGYKENDVEYKKNAFEVMQNGDVYVYNVGTYDGTNATESAKTLQEVLEELNNGGGSGGSVITYVGGNNIDITDDTITAKGYTYNNDNDTETLEFSDNILSLGGGNATIHYDADEQQTTFGNINGLNVTADGEMSISNTSDINVSTSEGDIKIVGGDNVAITAKGHSMDIITEGDMNITAKGHSMDIITEGDMNITAKGQSMDITNTVGGINVSSNNNINITVSNNFSVDSSSFSSTCPITAEVNGVENVYLGCPIGTIVMWAGNTAPDGWLLCDGTGIPVYNPEGPYISKACTIQGEELNDNELTQLVFQVFKKSPDGSDSLYGRANYYYVNEEQKWIKEGTRSVQDGTTYFDITEYTTDVKEALKFYDTSIDAFRKNQAILTVIKYQCINLPDLQQKFPLGAMNSGTISTYSTNLGDTGGEDMHTLTINEMPSHNHEVFNKDGSGYRGAGFDYLSQTVSPEGWTGGYTENGGGDGDVDWLNTTGGSQPHNNIPPFLAINFIIKYK